MRNCPFNGCHRTIADSLFACKGHWFQLDDLARSRIHEAYSAYLSGALSVDDLRQIQQDVLGSRGQA